MGYAVSDLTVYSQQSNNLYFSAACAEQLRKSTTRIFMSGCPPVCPPGTTRLPQNGFPCNLVIEDFY